MRRLPRGTSWWLVNCETADEGRFIIGCAPTDKVRPGMVPGLVLSAGGRKRSSYVQAAK
jgi:hypothetical protein